MNKLLPLLAIGTAAIVGYMAQPAFDAALAIRATMQGVAAQAPARDYERETVACMVAGGPCTSILYDYAQAEGQQAAINGTTRAALTAGQILTRHMLDNR